MRRLARSCCGACCPRLHRRQRSPTRSATSPSTATAALSLPAAASTSITCSISPRSPRSRRETVSARPGSPSGSPRGLDLRIDGRRAALRVLEHEATFRPGAGGLKTLRFEAVYVADRSRERSSLSTTGTTRSDRLAGGRRQRARRRRARASSTVPATSESNELRAYPKDLLLLASGHRVGDRHLRARDRARVLRPHSRARQRRARARRLRVAHRGGPRPRRPVRSPLLVAAFWGAAHALTPGHGKAIVAGYIVGSRGQSRHAVFLGLIVTVTHTIGVFALGLVTLLLSQFIVPERLYPWLTVASGLLVVAVGASVFRSRLRHRQAHAHGHDHHAPRITASRARGGSSASEWPPASFHARPRSSFF